MSNNMNTYTSSGFKPVTAENMRDAAEVFANRAARKRFGRSGYARTCRMDAYAQDGRLAEFEAFIGYSSRGNPHETTGHCEPLGSGEVVS